MRRLTTAVIVAVALSGCSIAFVRGPPSTPTKSCSRSAAGPVAADVVLGLAGLAIGGFYGLLYYATHGADEIIGAPEHVVRVAAPLAGVLPWAISAGVGLYRAHACRSQEAPKIPTETERREADEAEEARLPHAARVNRGRARALTDQAAERARAGDCASVLERDREVRDLDPEFHAAVFMRDDVIKWCLDGAPDQR